MLGAIFAGIMAGGTMFLIIVGFMAVAAYIPRLRLGNRR